MFLFNPGTALMGRLTMPRKLFLLAVLFLVPLAVCLFVILRNELDSYASTEQEAEGVKLLQTSQELLKAVQRRRGTSAALLAGNETMRSSFEAADSEGEKLAASLRASAANIKSFDISAEAVALAEQYAKVKAVPLTAPAGELFDAHTALVHAIFGFTAELADRSTLALDPEAATYYIMNTVVFSLPASAELAAITRGRGAAALARGSLDEANRGALGVYGNLLREQIATVRQDLNRAQRTLGKSDEKQQVQAPNIADFDAFASSVIELASGSGSKLTNSTEYFDLGSRAVDAVYAAHGKLSDRLRSLLVQRKQANARSVALIGAISVLSVAFALYLFVAFARRTASDVKEIADCMQRVGAGDLRGQLSTNGKDELALIRRGMNELLFALNRILQATKASAVSVFSGSEEIAAGNLDLSVRTEEQAASLEETAASMEELTSTVRHNVENARRAGVLSREASSRAADSGEVIVKAVEVMQEFGKRSAEMAQIIGTIEGIAFQTNILALNAAVEAARAGNHGKGFAVVAAEVRMLAHRSALAAKDVKEMIERSGKSVAGGTQLFSAAHEAVASAISSINDVDTIVNEIAGASTQQGAGIEQMNIAITQLDQATQQNAALVEQSAAASASLKEQALKMERLVSDFKFDC